MQSNLAPYSKRVQVTQIGHYWLLLGSVGFLGSVELSGVCWALIVYWVLLLFPLISICRPKVWLS